MIQPRVYADFHNADRQGRLRLNCIGTTKDLALHQIHLREGLALTFYSDDSDEKGQPKELEVKGVVQYSEDEKCWVAAIDWSAIHQISPREDQGPDGDGVTAPTTPTDGRRSTSSS